MSSSGLDPIPSPDTAGTLHTRCLMDMDETCSFSCCPGRSASRKETEICELFLRKSKQRGSSAALHPWCRQPQKTLVVYGRQLPHKHVASNRWDSAHPSGQGISLYNSLGAAVHEIFTRLYPGMFGWLPHSQGKYHKKYTKLSFCIFLSLFSHLGIPTLKKKIRKYTKTDQGFTLR